MKFLAKIDIIIDFFVKLFIFIIKNSIFAGRETEVRNSEGQRFLAYSHRPRFSLF